MLYLSSQPVALGPYIGKVFNVVDHRLLFPKQRLDMVDNCIASNPGSSRNIFHAGEHYVPPTFAKSFDVLILHPTRPKFLRDYTTDLRKNVVLQEILPYFVKNEDRILYIYNNALCLLGKQTLCIPHQDRYTTDLQVVQEPGLGLVDYYVDYDFDLTREMTNGYMRKAEVMSASTPIYQLESTASFDGKRVKGHMYRMAGKSIEEVTSIGAEPESKVPPARLLYKEEEEDHG